MKVSVIIPTYNGSKKILNLISALEKQDIKGFEVIIVNDGSTDNTRQVISQLKPDFANFRVINQQNSGRSGVRNTGAKEASGDLLIFFDDDMRPNPNAVRSHVQHHQSYPGSIMTSTAEEEVFPNSLDFLKFKSILNKQWIGPLVDFKNRPLPKDKIFITAANFSVSKIVFDILGGFDNRLLDSEDYDLAVRAFKAGIPLFFNADAFGWHDDLCSCHSFIKRQRQYQVATKKLISLQPWLLEERFLKEDPKIINTKRVFFRLFAFPFWINAVDSGKFKFLPKSIRYRLYNFIVTSNGVYFPEKVKL